MCGKGQHPVDEWLPPLLDGMVNSLRSELATSFNSIRHTGARVAKVSDARPMTSAGTVVGYALRETAGAAATVVLRDGSDANGAVVFPIALAANQSVCMWLGPGGVSILESLFVTTTGAVEGSIFLGGVE